MATLGDRCCPCNPCCKWKNNETTGWIIDAMARAAVVISGVFLGTGLLRLANLDAGCLVYYTTPADEWTGELPDSDNAATKDVVEVELTYEDLHPGEECPFKVYGMRPSSLLPAMGTVTGLLAAFTMPMIGAMVDHTRYRWHVGVGSAGFIILAAVFMAFISETTYFAVAVVSTAVGYVNLIHCVVQYAYFPELTLDPVELGQISAMSNLWQFFTQVMFIIFVAGPTFALGLDAIGSSKLSQAIQIIFSGSMFAFSWTQLLEHRPPLHPMPPNESLITVGFSRLGKTLRELRSEFKTVTIFLAGMAFAEAAMTAFTTIAITYSTIVLGMSGFEASMLILICLVFAVPGSFIFGILTKKVGPFKSYLMSLVWWAAVTIIAPFFMNSPKQKSAAYVFGVLWGVGFGWLYPTQRTSYTLIIPAGQESELMGIYIFAGQILGWMPPLIFTGLNEAGISMKFGLIADACFFIAALAVMSIFIGVRGFDNAVVLAKATATRREQVIQGAAKRRESIMLDDDKDRNALPHTMRNPLPGAHKVPQEKDMNDQL